MTDKHSPTPWSVRKTKEGKEICDKNGASIALMYSQDDDPDVIVRAVNRHESDKQKIKMLVEALGAVKNMANVAGYQEWRDKQKILDRIIEMIDKAIAQAKAE